MANEPDRIVPLNQLSDFEVAEGEPDVTGWDVIGSDGRKIGEVDQLLVDTTAMKVRYLDVDIEDDLLEPGEDRHVLIPIGFARLHEDENRVLVDNLPSEEVADLPDYGHEPVTREMEAMVRERFERGAVGAAPTEEIYERETFEEGPSYGARRELREERRELREERREPSEERREAREERREVPEERAELRVTRSEEELNVGKREVSAGQVEIEKHVETEHVRRPVRLRHEEVDIERRPVERMEAGEARIEEEDIHIPLTEEEAVVEKRPVVREELVVRKRPVEETEQVEGDIRRERIDIEEHGRVEREDEGEREEEGER
ncbi:MAG TPA: DUF2382 domain-containing protein [Longimicrobiales bacterium]